MTCAAIECKPRYDLDTVDQRLQIGWVSIRIIHAKDGAIGDNNFTARIRNRDRLRVYRRAAANALHSRRVAMEIIDRRANLAQSFAESLLTLSLDCNLSQGQYSQR